MLRTFSIHMSISLADCLGNSDAGAENTWLLWSLLGLYPLTTTPIYLLGSPSFPSVNVSVNYNYTLQIRADNLDQGPYVQAVTVNGQSWDKNWIEHQDLMITGGELVFTMGSEAKQWETGPPPPSLGHVQL